MSLEDDFQAASKAAMSLPAQGPESLLEMYGLYKQATSGDADGKRPGAFNLRARAKYDAWKSRAGMSQDDARQAYIAAVAAKKAP